MLTLFFPPLEVAKLVAVNTTVRIFVRQIHSHASWVEVDYSLWLERNLGIFLRMSDCCNQAWVLKNSLITPIRQTLGDRKCLGDPRKSIVGLPGAFLFSSILRQGVFQQPLAFAPTTDRPGQLVKSPSMRRPAGVKGFFCCFVAQGFSPAESPLSPPFHPHSCERFSLGASWVFSFQPVLPPVSRPLLPSMTEAGPGD
jgi:hypothetical protein